MNHPKADEIPFVKVIHGKNQNDSFPYRASLLRMVGSHFEMTSKKNK